MVNMKIFLKVSEIQDDVKSDLNKIKNGQLEDVDGALVKDYQKRKLVETV